MQKFLSVVFIILFSVFTGCKKDESSSTDPGSGTAAIPQVTFRGPNTNSTDANAQTAKAYATSMNGVMSSSSIFSQMPAQQNGNTYTWTYGGGGMSYTFTGQKQSDGSFTWTFTFTGTQGSTNYTNFKMWEGTTSADGKSGSWTFYEPGHAGKTEDLVYSTDANGVLTGTWYIYNTSGTLSGKLVIVNNTDGSGRIENYNNGTILSYKAVWAANGTGTWYFYNSSGVQSSTGTWQ
jgi:hypothetical protein